MKPSIFRRVIALVSLCISQSVHAENSSLVGTFDGIIRSNHDQPGITEFYTTNQNIEARYTFTDADVDSEGLLNHCNLMVFVLRCIWNDDYGTGDFVVGFKSNFFHFSGKWFDETSSDQRHISDPDGNLWSGEMRKKGVKLVTQPN